jgi:hypothetical protein
MLTIKLEFPAIKMLFITDHYLRLLLLVSASNSCNHYKRYEKAEMKSIAEFI